MKNTRRITAIVISVTLILCNMVASASGFGSLLPNIAFDDVNESHQYYNEITELENRKYIIGIAQDIYAPDDNTTRAEFLKMLLYSVNKNENSEYKNILSDVPQEHWASGYIMRALEVGIFDCSELTNCEFRPDDYIDKETAALWITRAIGSLMETELTVDDKDEITQPEAVASVLDLGIMTATDNIFNPHKNFTRADAAYIAKQVMDKYAELEFVNEDKDDYAYKEDLIMPTVDSDTNVITENTDEYVFMNNIDETIRNLSVGSVFFVKPCPDVPNGFVAKVKSISVSGDTAMIYKEAADIEEVFSYIDVSKSVPVEAEYITLEDGFEFVDDVSFTQLNAVDSLSNDAKYNPKAAKAVLRSAVPIAVNHKLSDNSTLTGTLTLGLSVDCKFDMSPNVLLKANTETSFDLSFKASGKNHSSEDVKLGTVSMPIGTSGLIATGDIYLSIEVNGSVGVKFEQKNSFGFQYKNGKFRAINEKSGDGLTPNAKIAGSIYVGPKMELSVGICDDIGCGVNATLAGGFETETETKHLLCVKGSAGLKFTFEVFVKLLFAKPSYKPADIKFSYGDFYIHEGSFDWGDCPYLNNDNPKPDIPTGPTCPKCGSSKISRTYTPGGAESIECMDCGYNTHKDAETASSNKQQLSETAREIKNDLISEPWACAMVDKPSVVYYFKEDNTYEKIELSNPKNEESGNYAVYDDKIKIGEEYYDVSFDTYLGMTFINSNVGDGMYYKANLVKDDVFCHICGSYMLFNENCKWTCEQGHKYWCYPDSPLFSEDLGQWLE